MMARRCRLPIVILVAGLAVNTALLFYILSSQSRDAVHTPFDSQSDILLSSQNSKSDKTSRVTFIVADFDDFLNDIPDTVENVSVRFPESRVVVLAGSNPYPPLRLPVGVRLILENPFPPAAASLPLSDTRPETFLRSSEYVAFVPDRARVTADVDLEEMIEVLSAGKMKDPAVTMAAWPLTPGVSRCLRLRVDLRQWTITYSALVSNHSTSLENYLANSRHAAEKLQSIARRHLSWEDRNPVSEENTVVRKVGNSVLTEKNRGGINKYRYVRCDALDGGEHVLLMPTSVLLRFTRPFLRPFRETLFIQNALAGGRIVVVDAKPSRYENQNDFDGRFNKQSNLEPVETTGTRHDGGRNTDTKDGRNAEMRIGGWFREKDLFVEDAHLRWKRKEARRRRLKEAYNALGIKLVRWVEESPHASNAKVTA